MYKDRRYLPATYYIRSLSLKHIVCRPKRCGPGNATVGIPPRPGAVTYFVLVFRFKD